MTRCLTPDFPWRTLAAGVAALGRARRSSIAAHGGTTIALRRPLPLLHQRGARDLRRRLRDSRLGQPAGGRGLRLGHAGRYDRGPRARRDDARATHHGAAVHRLHGGLARERRRWRYGDVAALLTSWATFLPAFVVILVAAPYVLRLDGKRAPGRGARRHHGRGRRRDRQAWPRLRQERVVSGGAWISPDWGAIAIAIAAFVALQWTRHRRALGDRGRRRGRSRARFACDGPRRASVSRMKYLHTMVRVGDLETVAALLPRPARPARVAPHREREGAFHARLPRRAGRRRRADRAHLQLGSGGLLRSAAPSAISPTRSKTSTRCARSSAPAASPSTARRATAAWPSSARPTTSPSSCCRKAAPCRPPNPGPQCRTPAVW